jgi:hypothetical protein
MAQEPGTLELPEATIHFFDPLGERYRTEGAAPIKIQVTGTGAVGGAEAVDPTPTDNGDGNEDGPGPLRSIRRRSALSTEHAPLHTSWWFLLLLALAPVGFLTLVVAQRIRRRRDASRDALTARRAASNARRALRQVTDGSGTEGHSAIARALNRFFAERFGEPASGLTQDELRRYLTERGVGEDVADKTSALLEACERARYAPGASAGEAQLASQAIALLPELDRGGPSVNGGGRR